MAGIDEPFPHLIFTRDYRTKVLWQETLRPKILSPEGKYIAAVESQRTGGDFFGGENYLDRVPFEFDLASRRLDVARTGCLRSLSETSYLNDGGFSSIM